MCRGSGVCLPCASVFHQWSGPAGKPDLFDSALCWREEGIGCYYCHRWFVAVGKFLFRGDCWGRVLVTTGRSRAGDAAPGRYPAGASDPSRDKLRECWSTDHSHPSQRPFQQRHFRQCKAEEFRITPVVKFMCEIQKKFISLVTVGCVGIIGTSLRAEL